MNQTTLAPWRQEADPARQAQSRAWHTGVALYGASLLAIVASAALRTAFLGVVAIALFIAAVAFSERAVRLRRKADDGDKARGVVRCMECLSYRPRIELLDGNCLNCGVRFRD